MIRAEELIKTGKLIKPHGIKGEIVASSEIDLLDNKTPCLVLDVEGIYVPFFIESLRPKGAGFLIKFERVNDEKAVKELVGKELFFPRQHLSASYEEPITWDSYLGYTVEEEHLGILGELEAVDDSTLNVLLTVRSPQGELLIPAAEDFFLSIDDHHRRIVLTLPEGLLELN
jgi:16S rRNA processing protein RimM